MRMTRGYEKAGNPVTGQNKDNKPQEWLKRYYFGIGPDNYPDTATHVEQYKLALAE